MCSAEPVWVSSGASSPIPFHPQPLSRPKATFSAHAKARAHCCRMGGWDRLSQVFAQLPPCTLMCKVGVSSPSSPPRSALPPAHPDSPHSMRVTPYACPPPFPGGGECGLSPRPHRPLLTLPLSPQASGAGCWRAAAGAPRQAPPPLHGQLHQHQVRGAGPWGAAVTAPAMHSCPERGDGRNRAVVGMGRGSVLPSLTLSPHPPRQRRGPCAHLPHQAEPPEPLVGGRGQPGW